MMRDIHMESDGSFARLRMLVLAQLGATPGRTLNMGHLRNALRYALQRI
jgi:hypothetical protein